MDEGLFEDHRRSWDQLTNQIRSDYGLDYFQARERHMHAYVKVPFCRPTEKIPEVIDDLVDAVAGTEPLVEYFPRCSLELDLSKW